jgi:hypothetical protein
MRKRLKRVLEKEGERLSLVGCGRGLALGRFAAIRFGLAV